MFLRVPLENIFRKFYILRPLPRQRRPWTPLLGRCMKYTPPKVFPPQVVVRLHNWSFGYATLVKEKIAFGKN